MCGIVGVFNLNKEPVSHALLRKMTDAIAHRGPDGEGFYVDSFVGLGHRRLAILDLTPLGHQPMMTEDGQYVLTYNGQIFNFRELRVELQSYGYRFKSRSDSEVVLYAYAHWGVECVNHFNGMFAFGVWDKKRRELFIARDRYGIKPLYYTFFNETFLFASEHKAILTYPTFQKNIDLEALLEYFTFQNIFTDKTFIKGIHMFPAGCFAKVSIDQQADKLDLKQYWDFDFREPEEQIGENEYAEELDRLFKQAVSRQLVSDVEVGAYLSGGIDSGSITAIAAAQIPYIKTFTCGFDLSSVSGMELGYDEREKAEHMSALFKSEHYEMVLKAGDMERVMSKLAWHIEEPRVGQCYPNFYVSQLASKFVKVVLSGVGGDELFGGYPWRYYRAVVNDDFDHYIDKYYTFWQRLIPNKIIRQLFKPVWNDVKHVWTMDIFKNVFQKHMPALERPEDYINHSLYFEAKTFLKGLLVIEDKLGMSHGLETRVPFLDNDLVDFAIKIPVKHKLGNLAEVVRLNENEPGPKTTKFFKKTKDGKLILRKVMERYISKEVTNREKQGFSAPDASWFKGDSINYVRSILYDNKIKIYEYLDYKAVKNILDEHMDGRQNRRLFIWSLLNFEHWYREYLS